MARFDRKVERTKKSFEFTQKEKIVETNKDVFKKNFTFKWVQLNIKTVCVFLVDFTCNIIDYSIHDAIFKCNFSVCFRAWNYYKFSDCFYRIFN